MGVFWKGSSKPTVLWEPNGRARMSKQHPSSIQTQTNEKKPTIGNSSHESLREFLYTVREIKKEKLEAEEIFKAVSIKTQRDKTHADLVHRREVTWFVFLACGANYLLLFLHGLKLIELPVSFVLGLGSLGGIAGLLKLLAMRSRNNNE